MKLTQGMALSCVVKAVDRALTKYSADNVDVVVNEETGLVDIMYHSRNNSFPIETGIVGMGFIDKESLVKELDNRNVGYCW